MLDIKSGVESNLQNIPYMDKSTFILRLTLACFWIHTFICNYMQQLQQSCTIQVHFLCAWGSFLDRDQDLSPQAGE